MTRLIAMAALLALVAHGADAAPTEAGRRRKDNLARFPTWAADVASSTTPPSSLMTFGIGELATLASIVPEDARSQLALGVLLLQQGMGAAALGPLEKIVADPEVGARARALSGCILVTRGRFTEALERFAATPPGTSTSWGGSAAWDVALEDWRAAALVGLGRTDEARALLAARLESDPAAACLAGDAYERDGDFDGAARLWRQGSCTQRLAEVEAIERPFGVLARRWNAWGALDVALAAAQLGDQQDARTSLDAAAHACESIASWTPDCLRLDAIRARVAELRPRGSSSAGLAWTSRVFARRAVPFGMRLPYDASIDGEPAAHAPADLDDWTVARFEQDGWRAAAVTLGPRRHTNLTCDDCYEVQFSNDGGRTFEDVAALGLAARKPYVVRPRSRVALFNGDLLQVEALSCPPRRGSDAPGEWPCDEPVASVLVFRIDDLLRDANGDGATDVTPLLKILGGDTDGDGEPDDRDPSPRVPAGEGRPWLDSFLEWLVSDAATSTPATRIEHDRVAEIDSIVSAVAQPGVGPPVAQETTVLVPQCPIPLFRERWMQPRSFPTACRGPRVFALSEQEVALRDVDRFAWEGRGLVRARVVFDLDGSRALVSLDLGQEGGEYLAERVPGGWRLIGLGGWVA